MAGDYSAQEMLNMQQEAARRVADMQARAKRTLQWDTGRQAPPAAQTPAGRPSGGSHPSGEFRPPGGSRPSGGSRPLAEARPPAKPPAHAPAQTAGGLPSLLGGLGNFGRGKNLLNMFNFKELLHDSDSTLILAMLLLLASEDADELLVIALVYILM